MKLLYTILLIIMPTISYAGEVHQTMQITIIVQPMCPMPYGSVPVNDLVQCQDLQRSYHTQCDNSDCTIKVN